MCRCACLGVEMHIYTHITHDEKPKNNKTNAGIKIKTHLLLVHGGHRVHRQREQGVVGPDPKELAGVDEELGERACLGWFWGECVNVCLFIVVCTISVVRVGG